MVPSLVQKIRQACVKAPKCAGKTGQGCRRSCHVSTFWYLDISVPCVLHQRPDQGLSLSGSLLGKNLTAHSSTTRAVLLLCSPELNLDRSVVVDSETWTVIQGVVVAVKIPSVACLCNNAAVCGLSLQYPSLKFPLSTTPKHQAAIGKHKSN